MVLRVSRRNDEWIAHRAVRGLGMKRLLQVLRIEDSGQDLVEYTLLIAFVALASTGMFLSAGQGTSQVWSSADNVLTTAATGPSSSPAAPGGGGGGRGDGHGGDGHDRH